MFSITDIGITSAFVAGIVTFFAPCTLPMVPAFLGVISGVEADGDVATLRDRVRIVRSGIFFVIGFGVVFVLLGALAGFAGGFFIIHRELLTRVGGALLIVFGLAMLGIVRFSFARSSLRLEPAIVKFGPLAVGASFALGWSPCIGPILASIFALTFATASAASGAFLLFVFSIGLAIPFVALSFAYGTALTRIERLDAALAKSRVWIMAVSGLVAGFLLNVVLLGIASLFADGNSFRNACVGIVVSYPYALPILSAVASGVSARRTTIDLFSCIGGAFLILLGTILALDSFGALIAEGFRVLHVLGYERILRLL